MRILVGWDDPAEAELLQLYLNGDGNEVTLTDRADALLAEAAARPWDAVLLPLAFPTIDAGFAAFQEVQRLLPAAPPVLACRPAEMISLPRFLLRGLRFYLFRDAQGDFMFLVLSTLESAVAAARAEEARRLAERLREEVESVRLLQEAIIPRGLRPPPGYAACARYEPAQVTDVGGQPVALAGGDYYDLFCPEPGSLVALVGDASGHGLKACMSIMAMHTLIRMLAGGRFRDAAGFVADINERLCENSIVQSGGGFITLLYAVLDAEAHRVVCASAGHPAPLLHRLDTDEVVPAEDAGGGGLPLGIVAGTDYEASSFPLPPRSRLLLYTDGLTDALVGDGGRDAFGVAGIAAALRASRGRPLEEALDGLFRASHAHTGGQGRHDDTSAVLIERSGP